MEPPTGRGEWVGRPELTDLPRRELARVMLFAPHQLLPSRITRRVSGFRSSAVSVPARARSELFWIPAEAEPRRKRREGKRFYASGGSELQYTATVHITPSDMEQLEALAVELEAFATELEDAARAMEGRANALRTEFNLPKVSAELENERRTHPCTEAPVLSPVLGRRCWLLRRRLRAIVT